MVGKSSTDVDWSWSLYIRITAYRLYSPHRSIVAWMAFVAHTAHADLAVGSPIRGEWVCLFQAAVLLVLGDTTA